ncbi:MAG: GNAT family N-acetyltransferase [Melioribacteraceae bacterium]|nr:GNAT family N-acetyltransferase [Melioribacteraceae bacterium]
MIEIKTLDNIPFQQIYVTVSDAFSDYVEPFDLTIEELKYMFERRGYDLKISFGAFDNDKLVGITINGVGNWNGKLTAYDSGTGIIKEYRKRGIASRMFNESVPVLRENGIKQYLLEVIKSNTGAYELYKKAGFRVVRELDYFKIDINELKYQKLVAKQGIHFRIIEEPDWEIIRSFWAFEPSWQNSVDSLNRKIEHLKILGMYEESNLIGYGIIEPHTGDIPQLAISPEFRRQGLGTSLFRVLINYSEVNSLRIINSDSSYLPFREFMKSMEIEPGDGQYEMILEL